MVALAGVTSKRVTPVRRRRAGWQNSLSRCCLREASASDGGLTVGYAAVVDGHGVGDQDGKTGVFEFVGKELKQKPVHEHTARERDGIEAFARADFACDSCRRAHDGDMEVEREPVGRRACLDSIQKSFDERLGVQDGGVVGRREYARMIAVETNGLTVERAPGGGFEFYGRLAS